MTDSCGGQITTGTAQLGTTALQLVGTMESRTQVTIRAAKENTAAVFLVPDARTPASQGFPLYPGEGFVLGNGIDSRGSRAAVYGVDPSGLNQTVYVLTEGH